MLLNKSNSKQNWRKWVILSKHSVRPTQTEELDKAVKSMEILKPRYIPPEKRQESTDEYRLI